MAFIHAIGSDERLLNSFTIQAISLEVYNAVGSFIQLIVVNCVILGRTEAYASRNRPLKVAPTPWAWAWAWASVPPSSCSVSAW